MFIERAQVCNLTLVEKQLKPNRQIMANIIADSSLFYQEALEK